MSDLKTPFPTFVWKLIDDQELYAVEFMKNVAGPSQALGLDASGNVCGSFGDPDGFIYRTDSTAPLTVSEPGIYMGNSMNDGVAVGFWDGHGLVTIDLKVVDPLTGMPQKNLVNPANMPSYGFATAHGMGINSNGDICGFVTLSGQGDTGGFVLRNIGGSYNYVPLSSSEGLSDLRPQRIKGDHVVGYGGTLNQAFYAAGPSLNAITLDNTNSYAYDVNPNTVTICGQAIDQGILSACYWEWDLMTHQPVKTIIPMNGLGGFGPSAALAIDSQDNIVGYYNQANNEEKPRAFLYRKASNQLFDLNSLVGPSLPGTSLYKTTLCSAQDINDNGDICGYCLPSDASLPVDKSQSKAYRLRPVMFPAYESFAFDVITERKNKLSKKSISRS